MCEDCTYALLTYEFRYNENYCKIKEREFVTKINRISF